jgi:hypothetical protein
MISRKGSLYNQSKQVNDEFQSYPKKILLGILNKKNREGKYVQS